MAEMSRYCCAYEVKRLREFDGWTEKLDDLRQDKDDEGNTVERKTLQDDDIVYLHESFVVTDDIYRDEHVIFEDAGEAWQTFCKDTLGFEVPEYEPIEIAQPDAGDAASA